VTASVAADFFFDFCAPTANDMTVSSPSAGPSYLLALDFLLPNWSSSTELSLSYSSSLPLPAPIIIASTWALRASSFAFLSALFSFFFSFLLGSGTGAALPPLPALPAFPAAASGLPAFPALTAAASGLPAFLSAALPPALSAPLAPASAAPPFSGLPALPPFAPGLPPFGIS
jgi:hypothetical protein